MYQPLTMEEMLFIALVLAVCFLIGAALLFAFIVGKRLMDIRLREYARKQRIAEWRGI